MLQDFSKTNFIIFWNILYIKMIKLRLPAVATELYHFGKEKDMKGKK